MSVGMRVFISILVIPLSAIARGWAIRLTWLWFVVPVFSVKPISGAAGYGLAIFLSAISLSTVDLQASKKSSDEDTVLYETFLGIVMMPLYVGIGWIIKTIWL